LNKDFVLNKTQYKGAQILLTRENFGCGSSREHAPWALEDFGFRAIIAPSFADIFFNNCFKNGILPIVLPAETVDQLFSEIADGYQLTVDLQTQTITTPAGKSIGFNVDETRRHRLLNGLDDIALSLQHADKIKAYEAERIKRAPWLFKNA
jgi:3-isopropylmalate/(R)-2-methylmalate dehydratase small subunit